MHDPNIRAEALRVANSAKRLGLTQTDIAKATGHSQGQVSRVLSGQGQRRSKVFRDVCSYVFIRSQGIHRDAVVRQPQLIDALAEVWDGTEDHAVALACVIRSLGTLKSVPPRPR